MLLNLNFSKM